MFDPYYYHSSIARICAIFLGARDLMFVALPLLMAKINDEFQKPIGKFFAVKPPEKLIVISRVPITAKQWRLSAGVDAQRKSIRFECIFEKRAESAAFA